MRACPSVYFCGVLEKTMGVYLINGYFDYPPPKVKADIDKIAIETGGKAQGDFYIRNSGGGIISGSIISGSRCITFEKNEFEGNLINVKYFIDMDMYSCGETAKTYILIVSNGGELYIPVFIKYVKEIFYLQGGIKISSLKDFFSYYKKNPGEAANVFFSEEFLLWLERNNPECMEMSGFFLSDDNRERALDNFFIFCGLKKKAFLSVSEKKINTYFRAFESKKLKGSIVILKKGYGYIEEKIYLKNNSPWIKLDKKMIFSSDFDSENRCFVNYEIDTKAVEGLYAEEYVVICDGLSVKISVNAAAKIKCRLSKEIYDYSDNGYIEIENNCGKDLFFEVSARDGFVKLDSKHYSVSENRKIPFKIKLSAFQLTQISIMKKLYVESEIYVKTVIGDKIVEKTKKIVLGAPLL